MSRAVIERVAGLDDARLRWADFTEVHLTSQAFNAALDGDPEFYAEIRRAQRYLAFRGHYWVWTDRDSALRIKLTWGGT